MGPLTASPLAAQRHHSPAGLGRGPWQATCPLRSPGLGPSPPTQALRPIRPPPRPTGPCPQIPEGAPELLPRSLRFLRDQGSCTSLGRGLEPLTLPQGLLACLGGGRRAGKTNKARRNAWSGGWLGAGRKCAGRPERRTKPTREPHHPAVTPGPPR